MRSCKDVCVSVPVYACKGAWSVETPDMLVRVCSCVTGLFEFRRGKIILTSVRARTVISGDRGNSLRCH